MSGNYYIGIDIGGTKCAVSMGYGSADAIEILDKIKFDTAAKNPYAVLDEFIANIGILLEKTSLSRADIAGMGISCGGPLDSRRGVILSPPNLPGWDNIAAVQYFKEKTGIDTFLQNDANACAVAEWKFGAGKGYSDMVFLTFGTGFGAGLILNGALYSGANDNAGEIGHIRLTEKGPVGYNKPGSAEGWCSGGGIAQIGRTAVQRELEKGNTPLLLQRAGSLDNITAKLIGDLAEQENDALCRNVYKKSGEMLGAALSILMDIINPEIIVIGGIYMRSAGLLKPYFEAVIQNEVLSPCKIVPAGLGEKVGDYAALSIAAIYGRK